MRRSWGSRAPRPAGPGSRGARRRVLAAGAVAAIAALVAAGCSSSGGSSPSSNATTGGTPIKGGTATWALPPTDTPNYIFPFTSSSFISVTNLNSFSYLLYRPLYWFGKGNTPDNNPSLSLANPPVYNGNKVTITLKHYMWSNGTPVTAQNVMFWLNMLQQDGATDWGAYTGFPNTVVKDIKVVSPTELTMVMDKPYSHYWFLYNELSQITPMPAAWDRTASGPSHCSTTPADCTAVYNYLNAQSKDLSTYVTSPIWSVVDAPWKLSAFNADGHVTFVPNKTYSGPVKPRLAAFKEVPFTTDTSEYSVLQSPSGSSKIDFGYIPEQDLPTKPINATAGSNPLAAQGYTLAPLFTWGISYYTVNLQSTTGNGPVNRQLYFRQALAYLMNQKALIQGPLKGYGIPTVGPVGNYPATQFLSPAGKALTSSDEAFPYNPAKAKSLLTSHGWHVVPGGQTTCADPAKCGPGVKAGQPLKFNFSYATGTAWIEAELTQLQSNAAAVGIKLNLVPEPFNTVVSQSAGNCKVTHFCKWDMADWGLGWSFAPDYYPSGETLFLCGVPANSGGFCDKTNDAMISKTLVSNNLQDMYTWQDYLQPKRPVEWQVNGPYEVSEIANNLRGATPQAPTLTINPENWYFVR